MTARKDRPVMRCPLCLSRVDRDTITIEDWVNPASAPKGGNVYGSTVAAPVAKEIIDALLVLERIPPSRPKA
jgi:hypothetical protein